MMLRGAQNFVLTSRSEIKTNDQRFFFKQIDEIGKMNKALKIEVKVST